MDPQELLVLVPLEAPLVVMVVQLALVPLEPALVVLQARLLAVVRVLVEILLIVPVVQALSLLPLLLVCI